MIQPSLTEKSDRDTVIAHLLDCIQRGETIRLPAFDAAHQSGSDFALQNVGIEANPFGGVVGEWRYQFEAEEDLLHLFVLRRDGSEIAVAEGRSVAEFVLGEVPPAMIWFKAGKFSQHFYLGHEALSFVAV